MDNGIRQLLSDLLRELDEKSYTFVDYDRSRPYQLIEVEGSSIQVVHSKFWGEIRKYPSYKEHTALSGGAFRRGPDNSDWFKVGIFMYTDC